MTWEAKVQVRQKSEHKGTMLYLEQMILKHDAQKESIGMAYAQGGGLDFYFRAKNSAKIFCNFIQSQVAAKYVVTIFFMYYICCPLHKLELMS
jgi:nonsense-mediated mRNA decay protein 3